MTRVVQCGVAAMFLAVFAVAGAVAQELPRIEPAAACFAQAPDTMAANGGLECGYVVVAQNRAGGADGEIRLAYMRIHAAEAPTQPPLFMLAGGPGKSVITAETLLLFQPELLGPALATRDIVLMEQRGTFHSEPRLDCPEVYRVGFDALVAGLDAEATSAMERDRLRTCIARHEAAGVDFASYNTVESAHDVDDVRAALGYDRIVYYGSSYATLLGEYVMRLHPDSLAAVILDGTDTLTVRSWIENRARNAQWGIDNLNRLCLAQAGCAEAFDIPAMVDGILDLFDEGPIAVKVPLPEGMADKTEAEISVTAGDMAQQIYALQGSKYGVAALPLELSQLIAGGRDAIGMLAANAALASVAAESGEAEIEMMTLMHVAMVCSDDPVRSLGEIKTEGAGRYAQLFARTAGQNYVKLCGVLDLPELPESYDVDVDTDIPVLLLSGGLDVQTPHFLTEMVAARLQRVTDVVFPAGTHVQIANINQCATRVALAFLDAPEASPDLGCVADEVPLSFILPEEADATE